MQGFASGLSAQLCLKLAKGIRDADAITESTALLDQEFLLVVASTTPNSTWKPGRMKVSPHKLITAPPKMAPMFEEGLCE